MSLYFGVHNHTHYSNIRLLDCINRPKDLINTAIKLGLGGIAITDHECLSSHMEVNQYAKEVKEKYPDFKIALGNEIYLTETRDNGQKYYHFILIAKDAIGHKALRELSSKAWYYSYFDRGMERVPTLKSELYDIVMKYPGHLIATTACMGGELSTLAYAMARAEAVGDQATAQEHKQNIIQFLMFCKSLFGDDFYIECAPSTANDQIIINRKLYQIASATNIKLVVGTDAHYLTKKDRFVHKAYLNSKDGDREVDDFYEFARLMDYEEVSNILDISFENKDITNTIIDNTLDIQNKIQDYSLERKQMIPKVKVKDYPALEVESDFTGRFNAEWDFPIIDALLNSTEIQERYWINECLNGLREKNLFRTEYLARIETEADVIKYIGEKLDDCLFAYFNTFKHYIDLFWECGSIVGPGRGSATGFLSNYLLGITQLDPIRWGLPYWRFLNKERAELPSLLLILGSCKKRTLTIA